jgi:hypothetical protein
MADADEVRNDARFPYSQEPAAQKAGEIERKMEELAVFRDAGVLTEAEHEEQITKLRWRLL